MISERVAKIEESVTLKLNSLAVKLAADGKEIFNLTAGQLPFFPSEDLKESLTKQLSDLKSYQYSPVAGYPKLRKKVIDNLEKKRGISLEGFDCIVSNGAKHSLTNTMLGLINPGDEVLVLSPYWISYPDMIKVAGGIPVIVPSNDDFLPSIEKIKKAISKKTKAIIFNSPNNPSGIFYSKAWVKNLASLLIENSHIVIISDEIYYDLSYKNEEPRYLYQEEPSLLERTIIIDGISKNMACTGLRIGYLVAPEKIAKAISNLQGHTASGANSLVQKALMEMDFNSIESYLKPINKHLLSNSQLLEKKLQDFSLGSMWYGPNGAFYFMVDLTKAPAFKSFDGTKDHSFSFSEKLIEEVGVVTVPGTAFGLKNSLRISLVLEEDRFSSALDKLFSFLTK